MPSFDELETFAFVANSAKIRPPTRAMTGTAKCPLERMVGVDLGHPVAAELELEEAAEVVSQRLLQRLEGNGVLARLGHVGEVDVV